MMNQKKKLAKLACGLLAAVMLAGCSGGNQSTDAKIPEDNADAGESVEKAGNAEKTENISIKFYGKCIEYTSGPMMTDAMEAALADSYSIDSIQIDWANMDTVIRTGLAGGDPCDIYNYPAEQMINFADAALDLTPYLEADEELRGYFTEEQLEACSIDGRIVCLPWESNFPMILANKQIFDDAGVAIPEEGWTYEEFMEACEKFQNAGYFAFANATDLGLRAAWPFRILLDSQTLNGGAEDEYRGGTLGWDSEYVTTALDQVKALYDGGHMFPGEGAVTAKVDEIKAGFYQEKLAMVPEIAAGAKNFAEEADFETVVVPWPSSGGSQQLNNVSLNALFIPKDSKNADAAVEVLKTYLSPEIQKIHADEGYLPSNQTVELTDPFVVSLLEASANMYTAPAEPTFSAAFTDYLSNSLLGDLVLNGGTDVCVSNMIQLWESE